MDTMAIGTLHLILWFPLHLYGGWLHLVRWNIELFCYYTGVQMCEKVYVYGN